jgi:beta-glucosidase
MINSGNVNGIPGHANHHYLTTILRKELNFTGLTVSDWNDVKRLHSRYKLAMSDREAVRLAVMSGVDMSMIPNDFSFFTHCTYLWRKEDNGDFRKRVDQSVLRILKFKRDLGLFESSYPFKEDLKEIGTFESEAVNLAAARESLILAKNQGILPLKKESKILLTGPTAHLMSYLNGGWSYSQNNNDEFYVKFGRKKYSILQALNNRSNNIIYHEGATFDYLVNLENTVAAANKSDVSVIVLCLGEWPYTEGSGDRNHMVLTDTQYKLATSLLMLQKPLVLVYVGGRPLMIAEIAERAQAVVLAFLPGNQGGLAIADLIYGDLNPSGKLPITYPRAPNLLATYDMAIAEKRVNDPLRSPLYEFGHGLSYTTFEYFNLILDSDVVHKGQTVHGSVFVRNTGSLEGKEVVIVYIYDEYASVTRPIKQMKFFKKISLKPNEAKNVHFEITTHDMSFIGVDNKRIVEAGRFILYVNKLTASFELKLESVTDNMDKSMNYALVFEKLLIIAVILIFLVFLRSFKFFQWIYHRAKQVADYKRVSENLS